ncbi:CPBP family glutamic-type intramembrane protease [Algoriphagus namhaensis]
MLEKVLVFLKNPVRPDQIKPLSFKEFFILLGAVLVVVIPYALVLEQLDLELDHALEELMKQYKWLVVIGAIILAPLLEEPAFRMPLDFKAKSIYWGIGLSILFMSELWFIPLGYMGYLFFVLMKIKDGQPPSLKSAILISSVFFGLVHLGNYQGFDWVDQFYVIPVLVGAQFLLGLVLSYIRINHGLKAAMLFHGAYNAIILIPAAIFETA